MSVAVIDYQTFVLCNFWHLCNGGGGSNVCL